MIRKMAALTAFFRKNSGVNDVKSEKIVALTLLNGKKTGVSGVEPEKQRR